MNKFKEFWEDHLGGIVLVVMFISLVGAISFVIYQSL